MKSKETIVILDFYSQFNQLIARRVRECNVTQKYYLMTLLLKK